MAQLIKSRVVACNTYSRWNGNLRRGLVTFLIVSITSLCPTANTRAQKDESPAKLREQIALLLSLEGSAGTSREVKRINSEILKARRAKLQAALKAEANALQTYYSTAVNLLSGDEKLKVEKAIRDLEEEARSLADGAPTNSENGDSSSLRARSAPSTPPAPPLQSDCYSNAPAALTQAIGFAAQQSVDNADAAEVTSQMGSILFFAVAHAISVDAVNVDEQKRDLVNRITIARLREQTKKTDKQVGASATSTGSTTAAEKPGFAELLGFAIEHGAIQQENNGTSLTLSTSPYALIAAGQGDTADAYKKYGYLSRVGISANFNIADQNNVLASARRNQLNEWSLRARLTPDRSDRSRDAEEIWEGVRNNFAAPDLVLTRELATQFQSDRDLAAKRREIVGRFLSPAYTVPANAVIKDSALTREQKIERIGKLILCQVKTDIFDQVRSGSFKMDAATRERVVNQTLPDLSRAFATKEAAIRAFEERLKELSFKPVLTFAYSNKRDPSKSDYSTLKFLYQKKSLEGLNIIANAGASFYHKPNETLNQSSVRDFAAALSFEGNAGRSPFLSGDLDESPITFSFTGRYQRLLENRHTNKKADIAVAQFKVELPVLTGFSLPFSVTYANATELIKESHVRANFGFTIDTDKILQVLKLNRLQKR